MANSSRGWDGGFGITFSHSKWRGRLLNTELFFSVLKLKKLLSGRGGCIKKSSHSDEQCP